MKIFHSLMIRAVASPTRPGGAKKISGGAQYLASFFPILMIISQL